MMNAMRLYYYNSDSFKALGAEQGLVLAYSYSYKATQSRDAGINTRSLRVIES